MESRKRNRHGQVRKTLAESWDGPVTPFLGKCLAMSFAVYLSGCLATEANYDSPPEPLAWDISFRIDEVDFSRSSAAVGRSLVRSGDPGRMDAFLRKCAAGGEVRIGFIGGSITEGALATANPNLYSARLCAFLGRSFPGTLFTEINAGIGATDSRYACSRVHTDLLGRFPDLIVLEFAVNDNQADSAGVTETMEGLIRKSLAATYAPVLLFHTMNRNGDSLNHRYQERLARYYDLPVVSLRNAMWPEMQTGRLVAEAFLVDGVHPNDTGHLASAYLLLQSVTRAYAAWDPRERWPRMALPKPLSTGFYQRAGLMEEGDSTIRILQSRGWALGIDARGRETFSSASKGAYLELDCGSKEVYVGYKARMDLNGLLEVRVDGVVVDTLRNAFPDDWGGGYTRFEPVYSNRDPHASRKVGLRLLAGGAFILEVLTYAGI